MELTPEQLEEAVKKYEEEQRLQIEYAEKEKEYRRRTQENNLSLSIHWQDEIGKVDKEFLFSKTQIDGIENLEENFTVIYLDLLRIIKFHCRSLKAANEVYPPDQLWDTRRNDGKITKLISHIEEGKSVCPPIIDFTIDDLTKKEIFAFYDGNHRAALCRFLGLQSIPFIVRKSNEARIRNI